MGSTDKTQLVMNNFTTPNTAETDTKDTKKVPRHLEQLTTTLFQSLFPPIAPQKTPLSSIRRVMLLNRETTSDGSYILNLRHYAITTKRTGLSKPLRRLNAAERLLHEHANKKAKGLPNLSKLEDIADYMIGGENGEGYMSDATSGSEMDTDAEVEILESTTRKVLDKKRRQKMASKDGAEAPETEKRAVKLVELGPRMKLRMTKVEEGVCSGKIMWHEYIEKTREEVKELDEKWKARRAEKEERRRIQKQNVERKQAVHKSKGAGAEEEDLDDDDELVKEWDSEEFDDNDDDAASEESNEESDEETGDAGE